MARSRDAGYVSAFEVGVANTEIKDESYKSHSVSRMRTRDRGYISKTTVAGFIDESFESIATTTVGSGGSSSITFSSIPATYKHLQIRYMARTDRANNEDIVLVRFNSDTGSNYSRHYMFGNGSSVGTGGGASQTYILTDGCTGASTTASVFGCGVLDVLDYADTNKYKTLRGLTAYDRNGGGLVVMNSGNWRSTSAITSITITSFNSANFVQYSQFALYGIKG